MQTAVDSMLNQTVPPDEIVMVCDGPLTAVLDETLAGYEAKYPSLFHIVRLPENKGLGIALQAGLLACRNELVARMDADDIALPDRMEKQLRMMQAHTDLAVLGGQIAEFDDDTKEITGYRIVPETNEEIRRFVKFRNPLNHMTVLMRRSQVLEVGGYQHFLSCEDYHLWTRLIAEGYPLANLPDICCRVRVNKSFYHRRGGWEYFRRIYRMEAFILEKKLITRWQFFGYVLVRFVGNAMLPGSIRKYFYNKTLRKNASEYENEVGTGV